MGHAFGSNFTVFKALFVQKCGESGVGKNGCHFFQNTPGPRGKTGNTLFFGGVNKGGCLVEKQSVFCFEALGPGCF